MITVNPQSRQCTGTNSIGMACLLNLGLTIIEFVDG